MGEKQTTGYIQNINSSFGSFTATAGMSIPVPLCYVFVTLTEPADTKCT